MEGSLRLRPVLGLVFGLLAPVLAAQEIVTPLGVVPRPDNTMAPLKDGTVNEYFLYEYTPQTLPVVDDFSVDRTRHRNATHGDDGVQYLETIYRVVVNGVSTPDMAFLTDTSYHYTIYPDEDSVAVQPNPALVAVVRDLGQYPPPEHSLYVWPPYTLIDTIGVAGTDTLPLEPNLLQDSLLVYTVAADSRVYINPDNTPRPWILWEDDDAYVNNNFPVNPPSIGVATLDGMDRRGYPYDPVNPNTDGPADKLTSVPINLAYPAGDSIYLSFFYEPIGLSGNNLPDELVGDSLYVDFYAPDEDHWYQMWSQGQELPIDQFRQVMIPVTEGRYLKQGFRMRFRNDASLGGMIDQWHVDYVRLDRNRNATDTILQDVAFLYQEASLLQGFTAVPYNKFAASPESYMATHVDLEQRNNDVVDKFITWGYEVTSDCGWSASRSSYGNNISNNASVNFNSQHPVNSGANPLVYDVSGCNDAAFITTRFWTNATPDVNAYNDTMRVVQEISNYYSYDDGSAEAGYSLNKAGAAQAYRFDTQGSDSLRALRIYFAPIFTYDPPPTNYPPNGSFIITIWKSLEPEVIIHQNVSFSKPEYKLWGPDHFVEYELDSVVPVDGSFYVGWVQTNTTRMNLGLDRNRDNQDKMFYRTELNWSVSAQQASWMIRPVMTAAVDPFAGVAEPEAATSSFAVYPNPAGDAFRISTDAVETGARVELLDPMGRAVRQWAANSGSWSVSDVAPGLYIVRLVGRAGETIGQSRLIIQR